MKQRPPRHMASHRSNRTWLPLAVLIALLLCGTQALAAKQEDKASDSQSGAVEVKVERQETSVSATAVDNQTPKSKSTSQAPADQPKPDEQPPAAPPSQPAPEPQPEAGKTEQGVSAGNVAEGANGTPGNVAETGAPPGSGNVGPQQPGTAPPPTEKPIQVAPPQGLPGAVVPPPPPPEGFVGPLPPQPPPPGLPAAPTMGAPGAPAQPAAPGSETGLTPEELKQLGLPGFVEEQPGTVPEMTEPGDLFAQQQPAAPGFESLIGPSQLPPGEVAQEIATAEASPGSNLDENFARVVVPTGTIQGSTETKQFHIEGGLLIYYREVVIKGDVADIDEKNEVAVLTGNVSIDDPKYTMKADELRINFKEKKFEANGFIEFKKAEDPKKSKPDLSKPKKDRVREYFAGQSFELYCKQLFYGWESKELTALSSVRIVHPSFNGSMERIDYNDATKEYALNGTVVLNVTRYNWIFDNQLMDESDTPKIKALTDGDTKITCDRMLYSEESGVAQFYSVPGRDVVFSQPSRSVTASYIEVNDKTKDFAAEGRADKQVVYAQNDGQWLFTGELVKRDQVSDDLSKALAEPLQAKGDTLTYNFDRKRLELHGTVSITSASRSLTAGEIVQDETSKFFLMRDNVHIKPDADSEIYAAQVYVDTANDVFTFVGLVQGQGKSNDLPTPAAEGAAAGSAGFQAAPGVFQQQQGGGAPQPGAPVTPPSRSTSGSGEAEASANVAEAR